MLLYYTVLIAVMLSFYVKKVDSLFNNHHCSLSVGRIVEPSAKEASSLLVIQRIRMLQTVVSHLKNKLITDLNILTELKSETKKGSCST